MSRWTVYVYDRGRSGALTCALTIEAESAAEALAIVGAELMEVEPQ